MKNRGYRFDNETSSKLKNFLSDPDEKLPLTEFELLTMSENLVNGKETSISDDEKYNLLLVLQDIEIKKLKEDEMLNLSTFIKNNYVEKEIYRYIKYIIFNQFTKQDDKISSILKGLGASEHKKSIKLDGTDKLEQYLNNHFKDLVDKYDMTRVLNIE